MHCEPLAEVLEWSRCCGCPLETSVLADSPEAMVPRDLESAEYVAHLLVFQVAIVAKLQRQTGLLSSTNAGIRRCDSAARTRETQHTHELLSSATTPGRS